jgi:hypothetical protein
MEKTTEALFVYAGHTMAIRIYRDELTADFFGSDWLVEANSLSSVELTDAETFLGTYPKHFAEYEAIDIVINRITNKDAGTTLEITEQSARDAVRVAISEGVLQGVN